jgi:DNA-binding FadR family transcriptional regulator
MPPQPPSTALHSKVSRAESLARVLEQQIVDKSLTAGTRLGTKEDLRTQFRVAPATVNEAVRLLETRGMIEARPGPGGGVFVAAPSTRIKLNHLVLGFKVGDAPFEDCLSVRNALEPLMCVEAAKHCTAKDAKALRAFLKRLEKNSDDPSEFLKVNWELHRYLARMGKNAPLQTLYLTLLDYVDDGISRVTPDESFDFKDNLRIHRELIEAIIDGEPKRLDKAIAQHTPMAARWTDSSDL